MRKCTTRLFSLMIVAGFAFPAFATPTPKSLEAASFQNGMTRTQIVNRLGQADFVVHAEDRGASAKELRSFAPGIAFELYWANGKCSPIIAQFDDAERVKGWDEGRAICLEDTYTFLPDASYSCARSSYGGYCG